MTRLTAPAKRMLTKQEAADYCGFGGVKSFEAHVRVKAVNYGHCVRFDRERLDEWLDTLSQSQPSSELAFVEAAGDEGPSDRH